MVFRSKRSMQARDKALARWERRPTSVERALWAVLEVMEVVAVGPLQDASAHALGLIDHLGARALMRLLCGTTSWLRCFKVSTCTCACACVCMCMYVVAADGRRRGRFAGCWCAAAVARVRAHVMRMVAGGVWWWLS